MAKLKLQGKDLRRIGYPESPAIGLAIQVMHKHYKHHTIEDALVILKQVLDSPPDFLEDAVLGKIADALVEKPKTRGTEVALRNDAVVCNVFGIEHIEAGAHAQMNIASRLPVAVAGALMPDAHQGYGIPIGGVLATENAVIPYGVGVDIGCRMCLTIYDLDALEVKKREKLLEKALIRNTYFGAGRENAKPVEHEIIDRDTFGSMALLRNLQMKAAKQLGTSGSGNHFVEFGEVEITEAIASKNLKPGKYLGLLSHSGSRGLGATIANHFTRVAMELCKLPKEAQHLAWLSLDHEEGLAYWIAMNLAGDYASACHHVIHDRITSELDIAPLAVIENHHNFAWKEIIDGRELIVHRKGATPADKGVLGIIPGSMTAPGYIVSGKGESAALYSASHGAGRKMSRSKALQSVTHNALKELLKKHSVTLIGGGLDEAPHAYKDIDTVMRAQKNLVDVVGKFQPRIVRMDG